MVRKKGFSLVELLIVIGGIAGVSLIVMQLSKNTASTQVSAFNTADYFSLRSQLDSMMSNGFDCQASFKGIIFKGSQLKNVPMDVEIWHGDQTATRTTKFISGTDAAFKKHGKLNLTSVKMSMPDFTGTSDFPQGNDEMFKATITVEGDKNQMGKASTFGPITNQINIVFDTDSTGKSVIKGCGNSSGSGPGFGVSQTWQKITSMRAFGGTYVNSTKLPIIVNFITNITGDSGGYFYAQIDSVGPVPISHWNKAGGTYPAVGNIIIPAGSTYTINFQVTYGATPALSEWYELR